MVNAHEFWLKQRKLALKDHVAYRLQSAFFFWKHNFIKESVKHISPATVPLWNEFVVVYGMFVRAFFYKPPIWCKSITPAGTRRCMHAPHALLRNLDLESMLMILVDAFHKPQRVPCWIRVIFKKKIEPSLPSNLHPINGDVLLVFRLVFPTDNRGCCRFMSVMEFSHTAMDFWWILVNFPCWSRMMYDIIPLYLMNLHDHSPTFHVQAFYKRKVLNF